MFVIGFGFFFVSFALAFANIGILNLLLIPIRLLLGLAFLAVLIILMVKREWREEFELPVIGEMAKWAGN
jgi:uncharacterized membrane protein